MVWSMDNPVGYVQSGDTVEKQLLAPTNLGGSASKDLQESFFLLFKFGVSSKLSLHLSLIQHEVYIYIEI